jgi:hypothetical protein
MWASSVSARWMIASAAGIAWARSSALATGLSANGYCVSLRSGRIHANSRNSFCRGGSSWVSTTSRSRHGHHRRGSEPLVDEDGGETESSCFVGEDEGAGRVDVADRLDCSEVLAAHLQIGAGQLSARVDPGELAAGEKMLNVDPASLPADHSSSPLTVGSCSSTRGRSFAVTMNGSAASSHAFCETARMFTSRPRARSASSAAS